MQTENNAADCQNYRFVATRGGDYSMHSVQLYDSCTDWGTKCQFMNLNARCAKSVLKWIEVSMKNANQFAAGQT